MAIVGHNIYRNGVKLNTELITDEQFLVTGLTGNTIIDNLTIKSVDDQGNESLVALTIPNQLTKPSQVQNLIATLNVDNEIELEWDEVGGNGDVEYNVLRGTTSGGLTPIDVARLTPSFVDSVLPDTQYYYAVEAENASGKGLLSTEVTETSNPDTVPVPGIYFDFIPQNPVIGEEIQFTSSLSNTNSVVWDFGDGTSSTLENPVKTYTEEGFYSVLLTATGDGGTSQLTRYVNVIEVLNNSLPYASNFIITENNGLLESTFDYNSDTDILENNPPPVVTNVQITGEPFVGEVLTVSFDFFSERGYTYDPANTIIRVYRLLEEDDDLALAETLEDNQYIVKTEDIGFPLIASVVGAQTSTPPENGNPISAEEFSNQTNIVQLEFNVDNVYDLYVRQENAGLTWVNTGLGGEEFNLTASVGNEPIINEVNNRVDFANNKWFTFKTPGTSNGVPYVTVMRFSKSSNSNMRILELGNNHNTEFRGSGEIRLDNSSLIETSFQIESNTDYIMVNEYLMNNTFDVIVSIYDSEGVLEFTETLNGGDKSPRGLQGSLGSDFGNVPFTGWVKEFGIKIGTLTSFNKQNTINRLASLL